MEPLIKEETNCFRRFRRSRRLVVVVVFVALMLDVLMMTSIDPIIPELLKSMRKHGRVNLTLELNNLHQDIQAESSEPEHLYVANTTQQGLLSGEVLANQTSPFFMIDSLGHEHMQDSFSIGVIVAAKPATEMITNIAVGFVVERFGHRVPLMLGFVFNFISTIGFAYSPTFTYMMATRMIQALGSSLSSVSGLSFLASVFPEDIERSKAMSQAFGGISLGIILGYPFGSFVYEFLGREAPFLIMAGITLIDGVLRLMIDTKESYDGEISKETPSSGLCSYLVDPHILVGLGFVVLQHFALGVILATGPAWMLDVLHAHQWNIGLVLAIAVIFHFSAQYVAGYFAPIYGRWWFLGMGMMLFGIGISLYPLCQSIWEVLIPDSIVRLGHGTVLCVISPLLGYVADIKHGGGYGYVYGLYTAALNLGISSGSLAGGLLLHVMPFTCLYWTVGTTMIVYSFVSIMFRKLKSEDCSSLLDSSAFYSEYGSLSQSIET